MFLPSKYKLHKWKNKNDYVSEDCNTIETSRHMMLECKKIIVFCNIVTHLIFHLFGSDININEKTLVIGYCIGKLENYLVNILINFAEYVIYKNYVKHSKTNSKINGRTLLTHLKYELKSHLNFKTKAKVNEKQLKALTDILR